MRLTTPVLLAQLVSVSAAQNKTGPSATLALDVDDLWNIFVGPVSIAATTTVVSPTPVPSAELIPPPQLYRPSFPSGQQVIAAIKNESWSFPKDFLWGVAGAAYQVEGAVKADGRGPSIWDVAIHRVPNYVTNNYTADISDNNYYLYKQDIARLAAMGVKAYSFSISWSRVQPFGNGPVNQAGLDFYSDLVDTCLQYNVTPIATLYHWDLPAWLQNTYGGWLGSEIVDDFVEYARITFQALGDRVKHWYTVNEPQVFCSNYPLPAAYFKNTSIPAVQQQFFCGHHVLLAHSQAYHLGKRILGNDSVISLKLNGGYKIPLTNSTEDAQAAQRSWDFSEGWYANPIFLTGDYPNSLKTFVSDFLPDFTADQKSQIKGSADIFAHDAYTSQFFFAPEGGISACTGNPSNPLYPSCANSSYTYSKNDGGWPIGPAADPGAPWLHKATEWVPLLMHYIQDTWANGKGIVIAEFGFAEPFEAQKTLLQDILYDPIRTSYYHDYMQSVLLALSEGVNIVGTLAWSFVDNLEWNQGYGTRFGMQYVNFTDPARPRYYKSSFFEYVNAFKVYQKQA
ncbi:glycoside hydrolase family 1 protein [Pseudocercospora fijiensis CIRAD86]|uniref:Glycoside hydrolase family 1 protein n=1 Tax=Pseudocercospora fijiensis (strain CIRAD86) TaxID=383855 RepID=M3AI88_PSEFD|nr:glycoside hydrolase family 1 protein [Pseudocercospora fijiensis CIRAD86]EME76923.1 glycoside hydrolase family 1 protein [Pseudocercospora fijiensis CIRAD86]